MPPLVAIAETPTFSRRAPSILSEEEIDELKDFLGRNPEAGVIVPNSGGVRKLRWAASGRGKRGGARVIYYYHSLEIPLLLVAIFTKNQKSDLDAKELKAAQQQAEAFAMEAKKRKSDMSKAGKEILQGMDEALRFLRGEDVDVRVWQVPALDVASVRKKTSLSQEQFAQRFRIPLGTLRNWEQGVRQPEGPARVLLMVIDAEPAAVDRALKAWKPKQVDAKYGRPRKLIAAKAARVKAVTRRKRP